MADVNPSYVGQLSLDGQWRWDGTAWRPVGSSWTPSLPPWFAWKLRGQAGWVGLAAVIAIGLLADQALRVGATGLAATATLAAAAVAVVYVGRVESTQARLLAATAAVFAVWLSVRASPWLLWPDLAACLLLLGLAASFAVRGSLFELGTSELAARGLQVLAQALAGAALIARPLVDSRNRLRTLAPLIRGIAIALPIAVVLAALLASADAVFASFFNVSIDAARLVSDFTFVAIGTLCAAGLLRAALSEPGAEVKSPGWRLGTTEVLIVLTVLDGLFAAFAVAQVLAATGAATETLRAAGVTYSNYARSGFFQLLWVSGITLALLFAFGRISRVEGRGGRLAFLLLAELAILLTLMIDAVAFRRLSLYEEAYGFTMLRLYSHVFAVWVAVVFVMLAADLAGLFSQRKWFIGATITSAALLLLGMNFVNPEAVVVAFNTDHAQAAHKIDAGYLSELSSDATPALLASRSQIDPALRDQVNEAACQGARTYSAPPAGFNWSAAEAAAARRTFC